MSPAIPSVKISPLVPRICSIDETECRVASVMDRIPITRVANITPLDILDVPVWCAFTPLASDLTTHLGKGTTHKAARVSAVMEAVERFSAERPSSETRKASWNELTSFDEKVFDPNLCELPLNTTFSKDKAFDWLLAEDIISGENIYIPTDIAISPPQQGILNRVDTNGLASGNSLLEASIHALTEVIERDAMGQHVFADLYCSQENGLLPRCRIDQRTWPLASAKIAETIKEKGLELFVDWLPTDIAIPTFRAILIDSLFLYRGTFRPRSFVGFGTAPDPDLAIQRAITEAIQSRLAVIQGARDTFNIIPCIPSGCSWHHQAMDQMLFPFDIVQGLRSLNLEDDLIWLKHRLREAGFTTILRIDLRAPRKIKKTVDLGMISAIIG
jgi:ribosomal protein S12 methylthiotransferase accessory factor